MCRVRMPDLRKLAPTFWRALDACGHFLYIPTGVGVRAQRHRWHHRIHLIPAAALERICDGYERHL